MEALYVVLSPRAEKTKLTGKDAPKVPPESMALYSFKRAADDMKELARQLGAPKIILGGHDWGGAIVARVVLHHPDLVSHLFSICTPYFPPSQTYKSVEELVQGLPNFTYQVQLAGPDVEANIQGKEKIRQFLNALYGGANERREQGFDGNILLLFANLPKELDFYVEQYSRNGVHGPLNWYRTRRQNFEDEKDMDPKTTFDLPFLFVQATDDAALPPAMSQAMPHFFSNMTKKEVAAGHWVNWQKPEEINAILKEWIAATVFGDKSKL
ncbi:MAG: hypothetical protein M4579_001355 [Chaenotheca gracillima]|nr:MAG: hypothetical protein M4579_001355 [Chaenotheca gracillima]